MKRRIALTYALSALTVTSCSQGPAKPEHMVAAPAPVKQAEEGDGLKTAVFAGGCFWSVEAVFSHVNGVTSVVSGYHGGTKRSARYDLVTSGITDHVEAVRITYDPAIIRYDQLLRIFFSVVADPTLKDRQGPDRGSEYNAQIIAASSQQFGIATAYLAQLEASGQWAAPIVTPVVEARTFYPAENVHQDFAARQPRHRYVQGWSAPKVQALQHLYPSHYSTKFQRG